MTNKIEFSVNNSEGLDKIINAVNKFKNNQSTFMEELSKRCFNILYNKAVELLNNSSTTNEAEISLYLKSLTLDTTGLPKQFSIKNGMSTGCYVTSEKQKYTFNIALAFEYGTGIIGEENKPMTNVGKWQYNVNNNKVNYKGQEIDGWWISKDKVGSSQTFGDSKSGKASITRGYQGLEIFRYGLEEIKRQMPSMIKEILGKVV